ncbi:MAG: DUF86 domain-containing protein [Bacteroidales bacterium]|nr:DUF86 domain-containing protein [Bacteroidales bacterium]
MLEIGHLEEFSSGISEESLHNDMLRFYAIVKSIENIGEAAYMLSKQFKGEHAETDWPVIECMRHFLVHEYYQVNPSKVWRVIKNDLPELKTQIQQYLAEFTQGRI